MAEEKKPFFVIVCGEKLIAYTLEVTAKMNKTYRFNFATRMENYVPDAYELLTMAYIYRDKNMELLKQREAYVKYRLTAVF